MSKLSDQEVLERLKNLKEWELKEGRIVKTFRFASFKEAMSFVNRVAELAESANHHPDIDVRYNMVRLRLISYDVKALTRRDFNLAEKIDALLR